jgi:hypothetical protein
MTHMPCPRPNRSRDKTSFGTLPACTNGRFVLLLHCTNLGFVPFRIAQNRVMYLCCTVNPAFVHRQNHPRSRRHSGAVAKQRRPHRRDRSPVRGTVTSPPANTKSSSGIADRSASMTRSRYFNSKDATPALTQRSSRSTHFGASCPDLTPPRPPLTTHPPNYHPIPNVPPKAARPSPRRLAYHR